MMRRIGGKSAAPVIYITRDTRTKASERRQQNRDAVEESEQVRNALRDRGGGAVRTPAGGGSHQLVRRRGLPGVAHEIKSAMHSYSDGREGKFRVFEDPHDRLQSEGGRYVFVCYRVRGRGIQVLDMERRAASRLPGSVWYGAGGHRGTQQREIQVSEVFG